VTKNVDIIQEASKIIYFQIIAVMHHSHLFEIWMSECVLPEWKECYCGHCMHVDIPSHSENIEI